MLKPEQLNVVRLVRSQLGNATYRGIPNSGRTLGAYFITFFHVLGAFLGSCLGAFSGHS